jgi:tetratricopeptide (TPR) repeat protein
LLGIAMIGLGRCHAAVGEYGLAAAKQEAGLALTASVQSESGDYLQEFELLGEYLGRAGRLEDGLRHLETAMALRLQQGEGIDDAGIVRSMTNIGIWLRSLGRFQEALSTLEGAMARVRQAGRDSLGLLPTILREIGFCLQSLGRHAEAREAMDAGFEAANRPWRVRLGEIEENGKRYPCHVHPALTGDEGDFDGVNVWVWPLEALPGRPLTQYLGEIQHVDPASGLVIVQLGPWHAADCDHDGFLLPGQFTFFGNRESASDSYAVLISAPGHHAILGSWDGKRRSPFSGLPIPRMLTIAVARDDQASAAPAPGRS